MAAAARAYSAAATAAMDNASSEHDHEGVMDGDHLMCPVAEQLASIFCFYITTHDGSVNVARYGGIQCSVQNK